MPKFVPVVDTEKPLSEQDHRSKAEFSKHRQFDNPYNINNYNNNSSNNNNNSNVKNKKKVVDRGWEQGNVGWGVLGSFGSNSKDDSAQVIKRVEGNNKMVKNEKGLWVKLKDINDPPSSSLTTSSMNGGLRGSGSKGRGRGTGIPVLSNMYDINNNRSSSIAYNDRDDDNAASPGYRGTSDNRKIDDEYDYKGTRRRGNDSTAAAAASRGGCDSKQYSSSHRDRYDDSQDDRDEESDYNRRRHRDIDSRDNHKDRNYRDCDRDVKDRDRDDKDRDREYVDCNRENRDRDNGYSDRDNKNRDFTRDRDFKDRDSIRDRDYKDRNSIRDRDYKDRDSIRDRDYKDRDSIRNRDYKDRDSIRNRDYKDRDSIRDRDYKDRDSILDRDNEEYSLSKKRKIEETSLNNRDENNYGNKYSKDSYYNDHRRNDDDDHHHHDDDDNNNHDKDSGYKDYDDKHDNNNHDEEAIQFNITAIQVINRFHEVYNSINVLFNTDRLKAIMELFYDHSIIANLKTNAIYLDGKAAIQKSFEKTISAVPSTAKRVFIEDTSMNNNNNTLNDDNNTYYYDDNDNKKSVVSSSDDARNHGLSPITFCLDFHRPGTAPGLGDKSKCTALLYRCQSAQITNIWGCNDNEKLTEVKNLDSILSSKLWVNVKQLIMIDIPHIHTLYLNFHDYDNIEVWGM